MFYKIYKYLEAQGFNFFVYKAITHQKSIKTGKKTNKILLTQ